jgi:hypothetical protein
MECIQFLENTFSSNMTAEDMKSEDIKYVK